MEQRITERVREMRDTLQADEAAVAQEIVRMAARSDISEEVERFRGHVSHWAALADASEPCGRKLDFLLQEMNREVNTMGSKADGLRVSELIIAAKADAEKLLSVGRDVVLVIDVQGARKVRAAGLPTCTVFVMPPTFEILEQRLRGRSKDSEVEIQRRLQVARDEVAAFSEYDFVVVNDEVTAAVDRLRSIVVAERARLQRMRDEAQLIVRTFS